uniref:Uncharacterized protein n=1 Tax=Anopheles atroparvus TaxID=41427 RepID=A0AAG5DV92_ANOAO
MSSKGKRASILKKQPFVSHNLDATATATASSALKGNKKIEFNRKKSIKEFLVGEDTDTIWGNSYEVSTDGTPSSALGDVTLGNSTCRTLPDEQNKENRVQLNLATPKEDELRPSPNSSNGSWDLSVTLADDERRRIRSETSVMFSQSLNTTDRLFIEPFASSEPKLVPKRNNLAAQCDVQAMDISPLKGSLAVSPKKSPRKMIYYNPKEQLYVEINDVPLATASATGSVPAANGSSQREAATAPRILFQTPTRATLRNYAAEATSQTTLRGSSFNVSETWNSHPYAMMNQMKQQQSNLDELANMSSDVDTTLAITNTVAKLLESAPNLTIQAPNIMELDESTTTEHLPTNALARARPSFLPSQRTTDVSLNAPQTPPIDGRDAKSLPPANTCEDTKKLDISSPLEERFPKENIALANVSLVDDLNQPPMIQNETMQKSTISSANVNKSSCSFAAASSRHGLSIDFGISSLSLKLASNSPETPTVNRPKILRPTLPLTLFGASNGSKAEQTPKREVMSRNVEKVPPSTVKVEQSRQTIHVAEDMETSFQKEGDFGIKPIETTYYDHPQRGDSPSISLAQTRMTVAMEESVEPKQSYRPTVHEAKTIVEESTPPPNGLVHRNREMVICPEGMEITHSRAETTVSTKTPGQTPSQSIYEPDPMKDHSMKDSSMEMEQTVNVWCYTQKQGNVRGTIHEKISIHETTAIDGQGTVRTKERQHQQQARRTYYPDESIDVESAVTARETPTRKTFYPEETMKVDRVAVQRVGTTKEHPGARKTIVCNESMVLDLCTDIDEGIDTETSISCRLYGKNIDELSIHAAGGSNAIDMKISRPTTFNVEQCEEALVVPEKDHPVDEGHMMIDGTTAQPAREVGLDCRRLTTHAVRDMEEDHTLDVGKTQRMIQAPHEKASCLLSAAGAQGRHEEKVSRFTTHNAETMDETHTANSTSGRLEESHSGEQGSPMNLTKAHNAIERPQGQSTAALRQGSGRKQRLTTNELEEMDASRIEQSAPASAHGNSRRSTYKREDMDATEIDQRRTEHSSRLVERRSTNESADMDATKGTESSRRSRIHSEGQIKTRFTSYGNVNMNDTSCFNRTPPPNAARQQHSNDDGSKSELQQQSLLSIYQTTKMGDQLNRSEFKAHPADITNYNAFLENHEKSHGAERHPKQRLTTYYMEGMNEAGLDSTRLSREREQMASERKRERAKSRPSTYHVAAMDETNAAPSLQHESATPPAVERTKHQSIPVPSPTESQQVARSLPPRRSQRLHQSVHHPEDMETSRPSESGTTSRRSQLRNIVQHTAIEDMEGFSLLADDEDVCRQRSKKLERMEALREESMHAEGHPPRGTILHATAVVEDREMDDTERKFAPKYRPTICHAEAMVEDTVAIADYRLAYETKPHEVDQEGGKSSSVVPQRKSSVCMEETMLPIAVRIERRKSAFEKSPILCSAEHPPSFQHLPHLEETVNGIDGADQKDEQRTDRVGDSRQTMHQASRMDMTLGPRESIIRTVVVEPEIDHAPNRRTIYNSKPMEETPPHSGRSSSGKLTRRESVSLDKTVAAAVETAAVVQEEMEKQSQKSTRVLRKPRQTILIPLDMEVDGAHGASPSTDVKQEEQSLLVRESTEDCVLRSVQSMATNRGGFDNLFREPSVVQFSETLPGKGSDEPGRGYVSSRFVPPSSTVHELSDISMCNTTMRPELPQIGNITGMMSMREITEPLPPAPLLQGQNNSVSVICRMDQHPDRPVASEEPKVLERTESHVHQSLGFVSLAAQNVVDIPSEDEFYDAEDGAGVDPLSLTKSRHLTMKFIDVEQLERTRNHRAAVVVPSTTSKRGHAQLLGSPALSHVRPVEDDPLHVTQQKSSSQKAPEQQTPRGPMMKRARTSSSPEYRRGGETSSRDFETQPVAAVVRVEEEIQVKQEQHPTVLQNEPVGVEDENVSVKDEHPTMARVRSQSIILDPSVFVIDGEDDLLDDESNPPCVSYSEEILPDPREERMAPHGTPDGSSFDEGGAGTSSNSMQPLSVGKWKELSFYRDFANLTIDSLDSWGEAKMDGAEHGSRNGGSDRLQGVQCISLSDEDSLTITPPKRKLEAKSSPVFDFNVRPSPEEVLDSTIASEFMYEVRQKHSPAKNACCGTKANECLCRTKRALGRRKEACDVVWDRYTVWFEALKQHISDSESIGQADSDAQRPRTLEEQIEELNWRLLRTRLEQSSFGVDEMNSGADRSHDRTPFSGQFPETPSVVFLCENLQSYLSKQTLIDTSPPQGAPLPGIPRITLLIANKLSCDSGTRWQLDCSAESEGVLVLRHRTLRSVVISVLLAGRGCEKGSNRKEGKQEERRLERIQVRECQQEYVHSPKLLLAHIEFMRLAKGTTERTLRSTYRTVASLMGLWQRFDELLRRVFDSVNRLVTIARNNDALLCYDAEMERFFVQKFFHRCLNEGKMEPNTLTVHFNWIESLCASGVSFKRPIVEVHKILPGTGKDRLAQEGAGSTDAAQKGLMFLECLLWNVTKHFDS